MNPKKTTEETMADNKKKAEKEFESGLDTGACEENATESTPTREEELLLEIEKLKEEIKERDDKHLRMAAEYDNFRRRSREEKEATYENALADTVAELLPIIDNLDRAAGFTEGEKVLEGLVLTAKATKAALEKLGIEEFGAPGDTFDPNLHNAVLHVEDDSFGENEIVEVFQKGYKKGKHIIRFAMVKTAN